MWYAGCPSCSISVSAPTQAEAIAKWNALTKTEAEDLLEKEHAWQRDNLEILL